jgi:hypothetical protein
VAQQFFQGDDLARMLVVEPDGERCAERTNVCGDASALGHLFDGVVDDLVRPLRVLRRPTVRDHVVLRVDPQTLLVGGLKVIQKLAADRLSANAATARVVQPPIRIEAP